MALATLRKHADHHPPNTKKKKAFCNHLSLCCTSEIMKKSNMDGIDIGVGSMV